MDRYGSTWNSRPSSTGKGWRNESQSKSTGVVKRNKSGPTSSETLNWKSSEEKEAEELTGNTYKSTYQASAPGEPPARRTGNLRLHWTGNVKGGGGNITLELESAEFYAGYLENGTRKMARRPFKDRITQKALPPIKAIFNEPYL